jgi:hypothetical protein
MTVPEKEAPLKPLAQEWKLTDSEHLLFDGYAQEHVRISGTTVDYYHLDVKKSEKDPLYNEPVARKYEGPYRLNAFLSYPDEESEAGEEGLKTSWTSMLWIPRVEIENAHAPEPFIGDIIRVWKTPYYERSSVNAQNEQEEIPGSGFYFDVIKVHDDGHMFDNPWFVGFMLDLKRRTEDTPERRLRGG